MEITILLFLPCFFTVKASVVRSDYVAVARTRDAARSFCQTTYHQGTLAKWKDIVNKRSESYQVWDGNSYQLSSLITIKDCTNDTGNTQYVLPDGLHWLDTAAQCQALCGTTTFATRGSFCHCLNESYTPTNDTDCIPMLQKPAALNIRNTEAKTVFQTVTREISSNLSKGRCLAANESDTCQTLMLKRCGDTLNMLCKGGTRIENTWKEAAFGCAAANSFPQPVPEECTIGSSGWLGGFRSLQYVPGSTVGTFCKRLSYSKNNAMPRFKEVSCSSSFKFYCIYNESGYNEICDVTKSSSCDTTLICSDRSGTARCLCSDDKYWYEKYRICTTKKTYGQTCDVNVTGICQEKMSCQPRAGVHMCDCNEQHYWDVMVPVCQPVIPYGGVCNDSNQCFKSTGVSCLSTNDQRACLCVTSSYWSESSLSCIKRYSYNATCLPGPEDSCIGDLKCKTFRGGYRCLCDQDALYDGNICQQGFFSAVPTNMSMAFDEANRTCSATSTYLADDNNFDEIFKDCVGSTVLFQAVIPQPESVDNHCVSMRMINGTVQRNEPTACSAKLPFVCIQKANLSTNNVCRIVDNSNLPGSEEQHDESSNSILWIILAVVGAGFVSVLVVTAVIIKRKRGKHDTVPKERDTSLVNRNNYDSVKSCHANPGYTANNHSEEDGEYGVLGQKQNMSSDCYTYSHTRQHKEESNYDTFGKPDNDASGIYDHTHNIKQLEGGEYGELGRPAPEVAEDDMYSHTKHSKSDGEYDSFTNAAINKDTWDLYDRTHNVLMESAYDEFTDEKGAVKGMDGHI